MHILFLLFMMAPWMAHGMSEAEFFQAVYQNDTSAIRQMIEAHPHFNLNERSSDLFGETPLIIAASLNHAAMIRLLIEKGAYLEATDRVGNTPLTAALSLNRVESIEILIHHGASFVDIHGNSVLDYAQTDEALAALQLSRFARKYDRSTQSLPLALINRSLGK